MGAVAIVDDKGLAGILTERDVVRRVTIKALSPGVDEGAGSDDVAGRGRPRRYRSERGPGHHGVAELPSLPIVDANNKVEGMLSMRHLLHRMVYDLSQELQALDAYVRADGPGG